MAAPTVPTLTTLTTEGLKKAGYSSPTSALLTRAADWMEEIKSDIFTISPKLRNLQVTSYAALTEGLSRYAMPTDFSSGLTLVLLDGVHFGTAQGGASGSITLAATEDIDSIIVGRNIFIASGTGVGSFSQCTAYNTSTKVATVSPNFATAPASGSGYLIVDTYYPLRQGPVWEYDKEQYQTDRGRPESYYLLGDENDDEFILKPVPYTTDSKIYGLQLRYYCDLTEVDLASTRMSSLYKRLRNVWIQGVFAKALQDMDDVRQQSEMATYRQILAENAMRETYGNDLSNLQMMVGD